MDEQIQRTYNSVRAMRDSSSSQRSGLLKKLASVILSRREEIHRALHSDFGKPKAEVDLTEIFPLLSEIKHTSKNLKGWMAHQKVATPTPLLGTRSYVRYEPQGFVLVIAPWNYPFLLALHPVVSAIAAGNAVILKPSEMTPHTGNIIESIVKEVFERDEVTVVQGGVEVTQQLLQKDFDHIFFTGSPGVGKIVMEAASKNLTPVTLELGGKSPTIIDETADLDLAAERICWGKFVNGGQTCVAPDYLLVPETLQSDLVKKLKGCIEKSYGLNFEEVKKSPDLCRIVNEKHFLRLKKVLSQTIETGGEVVVGGELDNDTLVIEPTILTNIDLSSPIMEEEIFGPLLPILTYKDESQLEEIVKRHPNPLALYVFSKDDDFSDRIIHKIPSGGACVNNTLIHLSNHNLPFGGVRTSGIGCYHGHDGFKAFSHKRAVLKQGALSFTNKFYPPYTGGVQKVIDLTLKYFS